MNTLLLPNRKIRITLFHRHLLMLVLIITSLGKTALAAPPEGQLLASQCFQCHGTNGQAVGGFESISGESTQEMYKKLLEMRLRRPESIMDIQARAYTPAQLLKLAQYLSKLPKGQND